MRAARLFASDFESRAETSAAQVHSYALAVVLWSCYARISTRRAKSGRKCMAWRDAGNPLKSLHVVERTFGEVFGSRARGTIADCLAPLHHPHVIHGAGVLAEQPPYTANL